LIENASSLALAAASKNLREAQSMDLVSTLTKAYNTSVVEDRCSAIPSIGLG
jgi:hypothetical protein